MSLETFLDSRKIADSLIERAMRVLPDSLLFRIMGGSRAIQKLGSFPVDCPEVGFGELGHRRALDSSRAMGNSDTIVMELPRSLTDGMEAIGHEAEVAQTNQTHHDKICSAPA